MLLKCPPKCPPNSPQAYFIWQSRNVTNMLTMKHDVIQHEFNNSVTQMFSHD